jgi:hypothetical protein
MNIRMNKKYFYCYAMLLLFTYVYTHTHTHRTKHTNRIDEENFILVNYWVRMCLCGVKVLKKKEKREKECEREQNTQIIFCQNIE